MKDFLFNYNTELKYCYKYSTKYISLKCAGGSKRKKGILGFLRTTTGRKIFQIVQISSKEKSTHILYKNCYVTRPRINVI